MKYFSLLKIAFQLARLIQMFRIIEIVALFAAVHDWEARWSLCEGEKRTSVKFTTTETY